MREINSKIREKRKKLRNNRKVSKSIFMNFNITIRKEKVFLKNNIKLTREI